MKKSRFNKRDNNYNKDNCYKLMLMKLNFIQRRKKKIKKKVK